VNFAANAFRTIDRARVEDVMTQKMTINRNRRVSVAFAFGAAAILALATMPQAHAQQSFKTPEAAADALFKAVKAENTKAILAVLGSGANDIVSSGDAVADRTARELVVAAFDRKHQVVKEGDKKAVVMLGDVEWPFPIPLVERNGAWRFDTTAGREEILYRRIGRNELAAIQVCLAYIDAQNEYAEEDRTGNGVKSYARRIVSNDGKKDGLYWPTKAGEPSSPIGDIAAAASAQGYKIGGGRAPFHGYYYRILTAQGPTAPGGAINYVVRGNMIGGFALVAYPAQYGNSGVMTFLVNHDGVVFQKDLGPQTMRLASRMTSFNPDHTWRKVAVDVTAAGKQ
jgi:hypothetical protein